MAIKIRKLKYALEQIQEKISMFHPEIEVLELINSKYIRIYCTICGAIYVVNKYNAINSHCGCAVCQGKTVITGINDIATTHPDLVKYFVDKKFPYTHSINSNEKTDLQCPNCKTIKRKSPSAEFGKGNKFYCPTCSDGISYPNKFVREVLKQLNLDITIEYQPSWAKPYYYDNYFIYDNIQYILEVDGGFHFKRQRHSDLYKVSSENTIKNDKIKNELAKKHNIIMIRIDAKISDPEYLKNSLMNSKLSKLFDLSIVDWNLCDKNSLTSKMIESCDLLNSGYSIKEIASILQIGTCSVRNYCKKGTKLGLCFYGSEEYSIRKNLSTVYVFDSNLNLVIVAKNAPKCVKIQEERYQIHFTEKGVLDSIKTGKPYKKFYYLSNKKIFNIDEEDKTPFQKELERRINIYVNKSA